MTEERYMVYASVLSGATGIFFWTHYRADDAWISSVLVPITKQLNALRPALARGAVPGAVSTGRSDIVAKLFGATPDGPAYVIAVHNGAGAVDASLVLHGTYASRRLVPLETTHGHAFGPFEVKLFRV